MVELASIIQVVASATRLALRLYDFGISTPSAIRDANRIAKSLSLFALMLKQVGTLLKEDLTSPSPEAYETVQDITLLAQSAFGAVDELVSTDGSPPRRRWGLVSQTKLQYLLAYVDSLNSTLSVMLQAFYTVRVIAWSRSRQDRVPPSAADAVANERSQLEVLIIEQQLLLLDVSETYAEFRRSREFAASPTSSLPSDQSLDHDQTPPPTTLDKYKDQVIKTAKSRNSVAESSALIRQNSSRFSTEILEKWTRLGAIERRLSAPEEGPGTLQKLHQLHRRDSYQPRVESGSDTDTSPRLTRNNSGMGTSPQPHRPASVQLSAIERNALPIPMALSQTIRSNAPFSPGGTYACQSPSTTYLPAGASPARSINSGYFSSPLHPGSNTAGSTHGSASPEGRERAASNGLGIPWRLWQSSNRWDFVDEQVVNTNSQVPLEKAYSERHGWTEIMQTWVRREAIEEARYSFNQVQKEMPDGSRTRFETCFCIGKPLNYAEIRRLVDRSIELYRQSQVPSRLSAELSDSRSIRSVNSAGSSSHRRERYRRSYSDRPRDDSYCSTTDSDNDVRPRTRRLNSSSSVNQRGRSSSRRKKESGKSSGGSNAFGTIAKYGGIATLLEGLPDILRGI